MKAKYVNRVFMVLFATLCMMSGMNSVHAKTTVDITIGTEKMVIEEGLGEAFLDENGRTQVPARAMAEKLGYKVSWDNSTRTAVIDGSDIQMRIPIQGTQMKIHRYFYVNGTRQYYVETVKMDTKAVLHEGRTYVPLRFVSEGLGHKVDWNVEDEKYTIVVAKKATKEVEKEKAKVYEIVTFTDKFHNKVSITKKPQTVVSFSPELTEIIFALGAGDALVGRSDYCDYPAETAKVDALGSLFTFNIEAVIEKNPDVVMLSSMVSEEVYQQIIDAGITPVVLDFDKNIEGTYTYIQTLAKIFDKVSEGEAIVEDIKKTIAEVSAKQPKEKPSLYYAVSVGQYTSTATGDTFIHDIIEIAGAKNAAEKGEFWMYTVEQLIVDDPYIVVCSKRYGMKDQIETLDGYKDLTAVKEGRLYEVDENIFSRQGPRIKDAILVLHEIITSIEE